MNSGDSIFVCSTAWPYKRFSANVMNEFGIDDSVARIARGQKGQSIAKRLSRRTRSQPLNVHPLKLLEPKRRKKASRQRMGFLFYTAAASTSSAASFLR